MNLIIIGASARAAAFSAYRAGFQPWCADLFADADLASRFPVRKVPIDRYPHGLIETVREAPDGPLLYTGGLENYPEVLAKIDRPLWGNPPEVLRRVRSPHLLENVLRGNGIPTLVVRADPPSAGDPRRWLLKPLRGSGGIGIRPYHGRAFFDPRTHYLQEFSPGPCFGAVFFRAGGHPHPFLMGVTVHLRASWLHAPPYHYAGSIVAAPPAPDRLTRIGAVIGEAFSLSGFFGADVVQHTDPITGTADLRVLEVNPRYTASVEVFERASGRPMMGVRGIPLHVDPALRPPPGPGTSVAGKAILYARDQLVFPGYGPWCDSFDQHPDALDYADIPHPGERIPRGRPVLTVFASASSDEECMQQLREKVQALDRWLWER
jgi:predicted ATP-grasp superfamily ATP-dependent carboligase